jgi:hypothetical protein
MWPRPLARESSGQERLTVSTCANRHPVYSAQASYVRTTTGPGKDERIGVERALRAMNTCTSWSRSSAHQTRNNLSPAVVDPEPEPRPSLFLQWYYC